MFITTNTDQRKSVFRDPACARIAVETLYDIQGYYPFFLFGFVIMHDHTHFLMRIPEGGSISKTIGSYKRAVTFAIGRGPLWQSRFHLIIPKNPMAVLRYVHLNPVRAGFCNEPHEYPWSSASGKWDVMSLGEEY
ncbi:transposase [Candidatus Peregrinibacteria bacterium]|nr:transposase [Candidatus Peregrinibacteria bacterium]MBI3816314.1 transposase [Candidatus Peregrinibacteria bacterium]